MNIFKKIKSSAIRFGKFLGTAHDDGGFVDTVGALDAEKIVENYVDKKPIKPSDIKVVNGKVIDSNAPLATVDSFELAYALIERKRIALECKINLIEKRRRLKDEVYLDMAKSISRLSKDEQTHIGCVIVAKDGSPVSWGYNGAISGLNDDIIPHGREEKELIYYENGNEVTFKSNKYPFMAHSEPNAFHFISREKAEGATIYLTKPPCEDCALDIVKHKISRVVVADKECSDPISTITTAGGNVTKFLFAQSKIEYVVNGETISLKSSL